MTCLGFIHTGMLMYMLKDTEWIGASEGRWEVSVINHVQEQIHEIGA